MINEIIVKRKFKGSIEKDNAIQIFKEHNQEVKRIVPKEKLLIMHIEDGWEPLCKFLGVTIPSEPFPHVNDTAEFQQRQEKLAIFGTIIAVTFLVLSLALIFGVFRLLV